MQPVIVKTVNGAIKIGYSGKKLGNVSARFGAGAEANFARFVSSFPAKIVYDMPAVGKDKIVNVDGLSPEQVWESEADALISKSRSALLTLRAADCIPLVFYAPGERFLALAHVGSPGAILHLPRKTAEAIGLPPEKLRVYAGPHISQKSYRFPKQKWDKKLDASWDKYLADEPDGIHIDLLGYVLDELKASGVKADNIKVEGVDTGADAGYFSHRRHKLTGEPDGRNCFGVCLA